MGKVVVVTSGKGGVGKTTSSAALGAALAFDFLGSYTAIMLLGAAGFAVGAVMLLFLPSPRK